jgi:hypothetical protein
MNDDTAAVAQGQGVTLALEPGLGVVVMGAPGVYGVGLCKLTANQLRWLIHTGGPVALAELNQPDTATPRYVPAVGSTWRQPRSGRRFTVEHAEANTVFGRCTNRNGNDWPTQFALTEFVRPDEDRLRDNLAGWRWQEEPAAGSPAALAERAALAALDQPDPATEGPTP